MAVFILQLGTGGRKGLRSAVYCTLVKDLTVAYLETRGLRRVTTEKQ
jgi:hypothetical protein